MFKDKSLIPSEAVRLCALGMLAERERAYGELAGEIRKFTGRLIGPSLDLIGAPVELMKFEGLVTIKPSGENAASGILFISEVGRQALRTLLTSQVRDPVNDVSKLVIALKMRFLHHLEADERENQIDALAEMSERDLIRLSDLQSQYAEEGGLFTEWLEQEIDQARLRVAWFEALRGKI